MLILRLVQLSASLIRQLGSLTALGEYVKGCVKGKPGRRYRRAFLAALYVELLLLAVAEAGRSTPLVGRSVALRPCCWPRCRESCQVLCGVSGSRLGWHREYSGELFGKWMTSRGACSLQPTAQMNLVIRLRHELGIRGTNRWYLLARGRQLKSRHLQCTLRNLARITFSVTDTAVSGTPVSPLAERVRSFPVRSELRVLTGGPWKAVRRVLPVRLPHSCLVNIRYAIDEG